MPRLSFRLVLLAILLAIPTLTSPATARDLPAIEACFTPGEDCTGVIVAQIETARREVLIQAYSFTSPQIAQALVQAKQRGVAVTVILDKSQRSERYSGADFLVHGGVPVRIDAAHAIAHNKVILVDGETVITGSFNFTKAAQQKNAENLLVIHDQALAGEYRRNWQAHAKHSEAYEGR
jgi:phosphatidylserine/phosphatidylglycerophosphate/cardiolipin synthase-like enzyme